MRLLVTGALVILIAGACSPSPSQPTGQPNPSGVHTLAGGCAGTVLTDSEPPDWSRGGWSVAKGSPWPVAWTLSSSGDAVAFVFAGRLVAGASPRVNGSTNKILWVLRDPTQFIVEGRPAGQSTPVITVPGGPSIVDVPTAGCWTFRIKPSDSSPTGTISLEVLPHGSKPG